MHYALVNKNDSRVHEITKYKKDCFEVHSDFSWVLCEDEVNTDYTYDNVTAKFKKMEKYKTEYTVARQIAYGTAGAQLDGLYHTIQNGGSADEYWENWKNEIEKVKLVLPKDSVLALNAAHDEILHRMNLHRDYCESLSIPLEKTQRDFTLELADEYINGTWSNPVSGPFIK
jgi:hypothetical protein